MDAKRVKRIGKPAKRMKGVESSEKQESFLISKALIYDVLSVIFKYLNGKDLCTAAMVCRSWLQAANDEKRLRGPIYFSSSLPNSDPDIGIEIEYIRTHIMNDRELRIKPKLAMFFLATPARDQNTRTECHCGLLPRICNSIIISTYGVLENNKEYEDDTQRAVSVFLPEIPEVKIQTFVCCEKRSHGSMFNKLKDQFDMSLKKNSGATNCLLLFSDERCRLFVDIPNNLKKRFPRNAVSVWGGIVKNLHVCKSDEKEKICCQQAITVAVALSGPGIQTWSIVIDRNCKTKEQVEKKLTYFKEHIHLKRHSIGLMFACLARGSQFFQESNVESTIFKNLFPTVPLVGCFGGGEFGQNTVPLELSCENKNFVHTHTSIFLIITYGQ